MKWYLHWFVDEEDIDELVEKESWATSWEEVIGYFNDWMSKSSDVVKGEVICYWDDTHTYGNGKPCLYMDTRPDEE